MIRQRNAAMKLTATMDFLCNEKKKGNKLLKLRVNFNKKIHIFSYRMKEKHLRKLYVKLFLW